MISYRSDSRPDIRFIADLYQATPLNRPVDDLERMRTMFENSNFVLTVWDGQRLVGILRGWHDGAFDGYICDLAIHPDYQKQGIGAKLLELARETRPQVQWLLTASRIATDYYQHVGWKKIENGWKWPRTK
jgi:ribosomal protein S18 acetylase RimI-like enzyme